MALAGYKQAPEHVRKRIAARLATLAVKPLPVTPEWLRAKYIDERQDCVQIGRTLQKDPKTIWAWLKKCGIHTRPRGAPAEFLFKKGAPSLFTGRKHTPETKAKFRDLRLADGHVPYLKNGVHHLKGKPREQHPNWKGGLTPERQAFYATAEWRAACVAVWKRADAKCERCHRDHRTVDRKAEKFHVHHIVSFMVRELRAEPSNLALLCAGCHRFVHGRKNIAREFLGRQQP